MNLKQGQVEFTGLKGHRAQYLVTPPEMEDPDQVLMHMFDPKSPLGWKLKPPNLILYSLGGRDHYMHWLQSSKSGPEVWGGEDYQRQTRFKSRMAEIAGGVCQAVTECNGWFDFGHGGRGGMSEVLKDGLKAHWAAKGHLAGTKHDTVVFAVRMLKSTKFHEEFDRLAVDLQKGKDARPDKLKQRLMYPSVDHFLFPEKDGAKPPPAAKPGENQEQDLEGFGDEGGTPSREKQLKDELLELAGDDVLNDVNFIMNGQFLSNCLTHIIFVQNDQLLQKLGSALKDLTTQAIIFANGRDELIYPGIEGQVLNAATSGTPVVVLHHTGGAAEKLGLALQQKRGSLPPETKMSYNIPDNVNVDNFLLLSTSSDSVEKVIDKLTLVLSSVQDDEMREVGYLQAERKRLLHAWELHVLFRYHANMQRRRARRLYYTILIMSFLTTVFAVFETFVKLEYLSDTDGEVPDKWKWGFEVIDGLKLDLTSLVLLITLLPLVTTVTQSIFSRFSPLSKYASLELAALRVRTEIYMYRTRTLDYKPRHRGQLNIMKQIERVQEEENRAAMRRLAERKYDEEERAQQLSSLAAGMEAEEELEELASAGGDDDKRGPAQAVETRRRIFAENVDKIHSEATLSDVGTTSLHNPTDAQYRALLRSLYGNAPQPKMPQAALSEVLEINELRAAETRKPKHRATVRPAEDGGAEDVGGTFDPAEMNVLRDDGFTLVTAEDYVKYRLEPAILHYEDLSPYLNRLVGRLQVINYILTGTTTALSLVGYSSLVPIPVAFMSMLTALADFEQLSTRLRNVNQCKMQLNNIMIWWESLSMVEKRLPVNKEYLVKVTEDNLNAEVSAFIKSTSRQGKPRVDEEDGEGGPSGKQGAKEKTQ